MDHLFLRLAWYIVLQSHNRRVPAHSVKSLHILFWVPPVSSCSPETCNSAELVSIGCKGLPASLSFKVISYWIDAMEYRCICKACSALIK